MTNVHERVIRFVYPEKLKLEKKPTKNEEQRGILTKASENLCSRLIESLESMESIKYTT